MYGDKEKEKVKFKYFEKAISEQVNFEYYSSWTQVDLVVWLERNILDVSILPDEKGAYLNKSIDWLTTNGFTLDELNYDKYRLRNALEAKISEAKHLAMKKVHQALLLNPEDFTFTDKSQVVFG